MIPEDLTNTDLWRKDEEDTRVYYCDPLNLKVILQDDGIIELRGISEDDFVMSSSDWFEVSTAIFTDTNNR